MKENRLTLLEKMLDVIMQEVPSHSGAILIVGMNNRIIDRAVRHNPGVRWKDLRADHLKQAIENGHPLILSGQRMGIPDHVVCFPLLDNVRAFGCVYLVRNRDEKIFSDRDIEVLAAFAKPIGLISARCEKRKNSDKPVEYSLSKLIGKSKDFLRVLRFIDCVKNNDIPVFISGESGTGKEVVARTIHECGARRSHAFVAINCGAIPDHLLESELFGFARGAFTGAVREKGGLIEEANKGTFFLDEIGDLSLSLQAKLLRVIQEKEIRRIGENRIRRIDVRFISATNRNIEEEVSQGRFREDLYYRLNIVSVDLPPLRSRRGDIFVLVNHFIEKYCRELKRERAYFSPEALPLLLGYSWPGNVRELQNEIQRCLILCGGGNVIEKKFLSDKILQNSQDVAVSFPDYFHAKAAFEKKFLNEALAKSDYNRTRTAERIGLSRQGLFKLMKKHGILAISKNERI